jgi:hypothetical protein
MTDNILHSRSIFAVELQSMSDKETVKIFPGHRYPQAVVAEWDRRAKILGISTAEYIWTFQSRNQTKEKSYKIPEEMYTISPYDMHKFSVHEWFNAINNSGWDFSGMDDPGRCREATTGVDSLGMPLPEATLFPEKWEDLMNSQRKYNYARMIIRKFIEYLRTKI